MSATDSPSGQKKPDRMMLVAKLAVALGFLIALTGVSVRLIASFMAAPTANVVVLPPDSTAALKVTTNAPRSAAASNRNPVANANQQQFSGAVVDAVTKQPVPDFAVRVGYVFNNNNQLPQYYGAVKGKDGHYANATAPVTGTNVQYYVRVEAHGYLPTVSDPLDSGGKHDFELKPGKDLIGRVLTADGTPVAGATVTVALPDTQTQLGSAAANRGYTQAVTGADGTYDLPPQTDVYTLAVESDQGYGQASWDQLAASTDIHVAAWGRIQGQLFFGTKPAADQRIMANSGLNNVVTMGQPRITQNLNATTGPDGAFTIERVPPGSMRIMRMVSVQSGQRTLNMTESLTSLDIAAGQTATVKLGGVGRPVTGKLIFGSGSRSFMINGFANDPSTNGTRSYALAVDSNLNFRIENVVPADYQINIQLLPTNGGRRLQPTLASFTMPDIPGGVSDDPLVIPDIKLNTTAANNNLMVNGGNGPTFSGKVVDAQTKQPVPNFTVRIGYGFNNGINANPPQFNQDSRPFTNGQFKMPSNMNGPPQYFVRIEAHGYLPEVSPALTAGQTHDFELTAAPDIQGHVFAPDGSPAAGAKIIVALPGNYTYVNQPNMARQGYTQTAAGGDGTYDLPPQSGHFDLVAQSDAGYALLDQDAVAKSPDIHLAAWGIITGQYWNGTKPAADRPIQVQVGANMTNYSQADPHVYQTLAATTDANGNFTVNRVPPGPVQVGRTITYTIGQMRTGAFDDLADANVQPGATLTLKLGGVGRPVVGSIVFPSGTAAGQNFFPNATALGSPAITPPPQMPDSVKSGSATARQMWMQLFALTPAGKDYLAAHPEAAAPPKQYTLALGADHKFRIENVPPGDYQITINLQPTNMNGPSRFWRANAQFTMPDVPGGVSDEPLVIPDIQMTGG